MKKLPFSGTEFAVFAAEDIYTPDHQVMNRATVLSFIQKIP